MSRLDFISNPKERVLRTLFQQVENWMGFMPSDSLVIVHKPAFLYSFFKLTKTVLNLAVKSSISSNQTNDEDVKV